MMSPIMQMAQEDELAAGEATNQARRRLKSVAT
jgi:hypothetical protein